MGVEWAGGKLLVCRGDVVTGEGRREVRPDDRFLLTSVAKPITATQVLVLAAGGRLDLGDPVSRYIPLYDGSATIRHLLDHSAGISAEANITEGPETPLGPADMIRAAATATADWPPGTRSSYCSAGFWLLAESITAVSGMPYDRHLEAALTEPLGMVRTAYEPGEPPADLVQHRTPRNHHLAEQVRRLRYPAGGMVGSVPDLLRFGSWLALEDRKDDVSPAVRELIWDFDVADVPPTSLGEQLHLGWQIGGPGRHRHNRTLWHPGASGTALWIEPGRRVTVAMLSADWYLEHDVFGAVIDAALEDVDRQPEHLRIGGSTWT